MRLGRAAAQEPVLEENQTVLGNVRAAVADTETLLGPLQRDHRSPGRATLARN